MGSVIDYIKCPRCKEEDSCIDEFYYKTGEEYIRCISCGYLISTFYERDAEGILIKIDPEKGLEFDNLIMKEIKCEDPYGAYHITFINNIGSLGTLETEENYVTFITDIKECLGQEHNIKKVIINRFIEGKIETELIFEEDNDIVEQKLALT